MGLGLIGAMAGAGTALADYGKTQQASEDRLDLESKMAAIRQERELALEEAKYTRGRQRSQDEATARSEKVKGMIAEKQKATASAEGPQWAPDERAKLEMEISAGKELGQDTKDLQTELRNRISDKRADTAQAHTERQAEIAGKREDLRMKHEQRMAGLAGAAAGRAERELRMREDEDREKKDEKARRKGLIHGYEQLAGKDDPESQAGAEAYRRALRAETGKDPLDTPRATAAAKENATTLASNFHKQADAAEMRGDAAKAADYRRKAEEQEDIASEKTAAGTSRAGKPAKTEAPPAELPKGSVLVGRTAGGKEVYRTPDGRKVVVE